MKFTALLLFAAIMQVSAATFAQKVTLKESGVTLKQVFKEIRLQTGYDILYQTSEVDVDKKISVDFKDTPLAEAITESLDGQPLEFTIKENTVVIRQKDPSFLDQLKNKLKAEIAQVTVRGKIVDTIGDAIPGVTVREKGTQNSTVTDSKGAYNLTVTDNNAIITFSYIGYQTREVAVKDLLPVIALHVAQNSLQEVIINKGYYTEKQELSTGDVSIVTAKTIEEQPVTDPIMALEGRVAGLQITQSSGIPGANETVRINGQNSIANGNEPLYIIDGVPFSSSSLTNTFFGGGAVGGPTSTVNNQGGGLSPFNALNPGDIESIEVLKDADATAIYGSRGANGVVLITTKKGTVGDTKVALDLSQGDGQVTRMMDLLNTPQYLQMRHEAYANDGITTIPSNAFDINGDWDTTRNTNWQKALIGNTAHYSNAQLSISGGTENTQFYVGAGFNRQTTVYPGDYDDAKGSLHLSLTHSSADKRFNMTFSGGYVNDVNNMPLIDLTRTALTLAPDAPALYNSNGSLNWQPVGGSATWYNPLAYTLQTATAVTNNLTSNMLLSYKILPGLLLKSSFGYTDERLSQTDLTPDVSYPPPVADANPNNREDAFSTTEFKTWIIEPQLSFDRQIAKGKLNILAGTTFEQDVSDAFGEIASGYSSDALISNPLNASSTYLGLYNNTLYRYNAVYARLGYTWEDKYLLNLTARRDGSSRFGSDRQWGNFGAAGLGWIFSKEKFVSDNLPWLNFGKLRGSYGVTGNDQIGDYMYLSTYSTNSYTYEGQTGLYPTALTNPYYGWETDKKLEFGLDLGFLKDRIDLTANYYRERSDNQLINYSLPFLTGFSNIEENLPAVVQNTSTQFTLNTVNVKSGSFKWSTSINLTIPRNELVSYPGLSTSSYNYTYAIGQSLSGQYRSPFLNVNPQTGIYQFASSTGPTDNPPYPQDQVFVPLIQKFYGGFQNSFQYKNFQLDVFFQFVKQNGLNYFSFESPGYAGIKGVNMPTAILNSWQQPGDVASYGKYSTEFASDPNQDYQSSTATVTDASYIRLKNLALSYTLPKSWQQAAHLQNARIYIQGQNLLTITNYFGLDPETQATALPPLRMIALGIHASL